MSSSNHRHGSLISGFGVRVPDGAHPRRFGAPDVTPLPSAREPWTVKDVSAGGRTQMTFLGHATFRLDSPEARQVIVDPWTHRNPLCPRRYVPSARSTLPWSRTAITTTLVTCSPSCATP